MSESKLRAAAKAAGLPDPNPRDPSYLPGRELNKRQRRIVKDAVRTRAIEPVVGDEKVQVRLERRRLRIAAQRPRYKRKRDRLAANLARKARQEEAAKKIATTVKTAGTDTTTVKVGESVTP